MTYKIYNRIIGAQLSVPENTILVIEIAGLSLLHAEMLDLRHPSKLFGILVSSMHDNQHKDVAVGISFWNIC